MIKQFCTYEIALALKELGFSEECLCTILGGTSIFINGENPRLRYEFNYKFPNIEEGMFYRDNNNKLCCNKMYEISIPLWVQAIDWFRTEHDIHIGLNPYTNPARGIDVLMYEHTISTKDNSYEGGIDNAIARLNEGLETKKPSYINLFNTYEEAREQAILKVIELCKK